MRGDLEVAAELVRLRAGHAELLAALKHARSQVKLMGTPEDAINNLVLTIADKAIANAEKKMT